MKRLNFSKLFFTVFNSWSRLARTTLLVGAVMMLSACKVINIDTAYRENQEIYDAIVDQQADAFSQIDPLQLSDEIKQTIDSLIRPTDSHIVRVEKLQEILYSEEYLGLVYSDEKTHTAIETFDAGEGNCLSAMNLYIAMARYAGVDAEFQTVDVQPNWDRRGDLLVLSQHINATGRFGFQRRYVVDFTPEIALQQLTSSVVSDRDARALYFNNLGVEALIEGDIEGSLAYFKNSLFLNPDETITWNNIGTTYNRMANKDYAEYSYQMSFELDNRNATAINNLAKFYRATGQMRLAREYQKAIERFNNLNPYYHYAIGSLAYADEDFSAAKIAFAKAIRLKEQEPDFYNAIARVYVELGELEIAKAFAQSAERIIAQNAEIYVPSDQKMRIIDENTILRNSSPGISIIIDN